jgi:hypothetical protein
LCSPPGRYDFEERLPFFVRLKKTFLEVCLLARRIVEDPRIRRVYPLRMRSAHIIHIRHYNEAESHLTEWLREAYAESTRSLIFASLIPVSPFSGINLQSQAMVVHESGDAAPILPE